MEVYLDGFRCDHVSQTDETVDDVLQSIRAENLETDRAILGVTCDGNDIIGEELVAVLTGPASDFERIDIQSGDPDKLVQHALREALAILRTSEDNRIEVVALFGQGKTGDAVILLGACLRNWYEINETIGKSLALLEVAGHADAMQDHEFAGSLEPIKEQLAHIKTAVKHQDYVTLSDILEYEFGDVTRSWREIIERILDHRCDHRPTVPTAMPDATASS